MRKKIILLVVGAVCVAAAITLFVLGARYSYSLYLAEFNAQIAANGIYKEDLHILNHYWENGACMLMFLSAISFSVAGAACAIVGFTE